MVSVKNVRWKIPIKSLWVILIMISRSQIASHSKTSKFQSHFWNFVISDFAGGVEKQAICGNAVEHMSHTEFFGISNHIDALFSWDKFKFDFFWYIHSQVSVKPKFKTDVIRVDCTSNSISKICALFCLLVVWSSLNSSIWWWNPALDAADSSWVKLRQKDQSLQL